MIIRIFLTFLITSPLLLGTEGKIASLEIQDPGYQALDELAKYRNGVYLDSTPMLPDKANGFLRYRYPLLLTAKSLACIGFGVVVWYDGIGRSLQIGSPSAAQVPTLAGLFLFLIGTVDGYLSFKELQTLFYEIDSREIDVLQGNSARAPFVIDSLENQFMPFSADTTLNLDQTMPGEPLAMDTSFPYSTSSAAHVTTLANNTSVSTPDHYSTSGANKINAQHDTFKPLTRMYCFANDTLSQKSLSHAVPLYDMVEIPVEKNLTCPMITLISTHRQGNHTIEQTFNETLKTLSVRERSEKFDHTIQDSQLKLFAYTEPLFCAGAPEESFILSPEINLPDADILRQPLFIFLKRELTELASDPDDNIQSYQEPTKQLPYTMPVLMLALSAYPHNQTDNAFNDQSTSPELLEKPQDSVSLQGSQSSDLVESKSIPREIMGESHDYQSLSWPREDIPLLLRALFALKQIQEERQALLFSLPTMMADKGNSVSILPQGAENMITPLVADQKIVVDQKSLVAPTITISSPSLISETYDSSILPIVETSSQSLPSVDLLKPKVQEEQLRTGSSTQPSPIRSRRRVLQRRAKTKPLAKPAEQIKTTETEQTPVEPIENRPLSSADLLKPKVQEEQSRTGFGTQHTPIRSRRRVLQRRAKTKPVAKPAKQMKTTEQTTVEPIKDEPPKAESVIITAIRNKYWKKAR